MPPPASIARTVAPCSRPRGRRTALAAVAVFIGVWAVYNVNGREIGSYDSQPTKYAAIELARRGSLTLDPVVERFPALAERPGFARDRQGHVRSGYPVLPAIEGAVVARVLHLVGAIDFDAPLAASLVGKLTASTLTALAAALAFVMARRQLGQWSAIALALAFAFGTNAWAVASQTLWQSETALAALCGAVVCLAIPTERLSPARVASAAVLLAVAAAARPQLAVTVAVLALSIVIRCRTWRHAAALAPLAAVGALVIGVNVHWFGHPLGAVPRLEALHEQVHGVASSVGNPLVGAAGLLVSPSRGLLVFSPIVLVAVLAAGKLRGNGWRGHLPWWALAGAVQFAFYASYAVWWGGHTYGPRYCLDLLPLLLPLAVAGVPAVAGRRWLRALAMAALAWSVAAAAAGAFVYPNERWNSTPDEVDRNHARLWDFSDAQVVRAWRSAPSPQNFDLFSRAAVRGPASGR